MYQNTSITDKTYRKLAIQVSLTGLSFAVFDTIVNKPLALKTITIGKVNVLSRIEDLFAEAFQNHAELKAGYDEIVIVHSNNLSTFVPTALFDEEYLGSYLQFNTKVLKPIFRFRWIADLRNEQRLHSLCEHEQLLYWPIWHFRLQTCAYDIGAAAFRIIENNDNRKMFVHVSDSHFEIVVVQNQQLLLFNTFDYKTPEDFIYYILFAAEQLQLNPNIFSWNC